MMVWHRNTFHIADPLCEKSIGHFHTKESVIWIIVLDFLWQHYNDVTMSKIASQITSLTIVYSTVYSGPDQTKHQSSASLAFVRGIHRGPVNSPHKWLVTRKMFPFDDVIMRKLFYYCPVFILAAQSSPSAAHIATTQMCEWDQWLGIFSHVLIN